MFPIAGVTALGMAPIARMPLPVAAGTDHDARRLPIMGGDRSIANPGWRNGLRPVRKRVVGGLR